MEDHINSLLFHKICCFCLFGISFKPFSGNKRRKLKKDAIPTIFPSYPKYLQPNEPAKRRILKRLASAPLQSAVHKKRKTEDNLRQVHADHSYCSQESELPAQVKENEVKIINFRKKLKAVRQKNFQLKKKVTNLENILTSITAKFSVQDHVLDILKQASSEIPEALFGRLTKNLSSKSTCREAYPAALQTFALTLHFHSPKAYR
jgi:predicted RNase H-like nuclease (RuvC/YqgF family)